MRVSALTSLEMQILREKTIPRRFLTGRNMFPFSYDENL